MAGNTGQQNNENYQLFIKLYLANERRIYGYVRALIPNWSDVDDLIQETVSVMWSKFDEFEVGTNFSAWALKIAHFQVLNYCKTLKNKQMRFSNETIMALSDKIAAPQKHNDERLDILRNCLMKLQPDERMLIEMKYEPGSTTKSISDQTGKNLHALYKFFNKVHAKLILCIRHTLARSETI